MTIIFIFTKEYDGYDSNNNYHKGYQSMYISKNIISTLSLATALSIGMTGCGSSSSDGDAATGVTDQEKQIVLTSYADSVFDTMAAAITDAKALETAVNAFTDDSTEATSDAAKAAWLQARESYGVTEIYRLSNGPIDAEEGWVADAYGAPEGQLNAWPLDENMIDYTTDSSGATTSGNIIDTAGAFTPNGGDEVDATVISKEVLAALNENGGDANVATGYHAIEFLLWGQDQDYNSFIDDTVTNGATKAGERPLEDYTSNPNADRRKAYLDASAELIVDDLEAVASAWAKTASVDCSTDASGCYRAALLDSLTGDDATKNIKPDAALKTIIGAIGVFIKSELANERIAVAVLTPSEEDEHSCFSDNTHRDILLNYQGFVDVLKTGDKSLYDLVDTETRTELDALIASIDLKVAAVDAAAAATHFDYQIKEGSDTRSTIIDMKNDMRELGDLMVDVAADLDIDLNEEDVTDPDETVL